MLTIVKKNDTYDMITYQLENEDNSTVDLTGASVNFVMGKKNKLITNATATITSAISGMVSYQLTPSDTLVSGTFLAEFVVTFANGTTKTYPSNGYITVDIEQNLDTSQANVVLDMIAEKQGEFTSKLNSILLQAGNINMSAMNEYTWTATEGQLVFVLPSSAQYSPTSKWFQVSVGNVPVDISLVNRSYTNQFALNIDSSNIKAGMSVHAMWTEPIGPLSDGHHATHEINGSDEINIANLRNYQELVVTPLSLKANQSALDTTNANVTANATALSLKANQSALDTTNANVTANATALAESASKVNNRWVDVMVDYGAIGDDASTHDDGAKIQQAINDVYAAGGGVVFFPKPPVRYRFSQPLLVPEGVSLEGIGEGTTGSILHYVGSDYAIKTSGKHQRNRFKDIRLELNGTSGGLKLGDTKPNLGGNIPIILEVYNFTVANIARGYWAYEIGNASHVTFNRVRCGYGTIVGGNGLKYYGDGDGVDAQGNAINGINSGVFKATDCVFGRVDCTDVALYLTGTADLDSFTFSSCYLGGQVVRIGDTPAAVRSVNFTGCHGEFRLLSGSALTHIEAVELDNVLGGSWTGGTIACFNGAGSVAFAFRGGTVYGFNIQGVEANGVMDSVFRQYSGIVQGNILQQATVTNSGTAVQYTGVDEKNFKLTNRFQTQYINAQYLCSQTGTFKQDWGAQSPALDTPAIGWTRGDFRNNTFPSELGSAGSKYVLTGWRCVASGTPGTFVEARSLTGN